MIKDCGALFVYKVNNVVVKATDNIVISAFIGLGEVGLYSNYLLFYTTARTLFDKAYAAVKASMGNLFATESVEKKYRFFQIMNYISVVLFGTACCGVAVCADELITVWVGTDYVVGSMFALLIGIEIFFHGLRINLGQIRNVSGVFRQMWFRPVLGIVINVGVSIGLVQVCGLHGVIIGTIVSDLLTNFLIDPKVIHKYSFQNYKPVSEYYRKNLGYLMVLAVVTAANMWIGSWFFVGHGWYSVIVHGFLAAVTVPATFMLIYWKSEECKYLVNQGGKVLKKLVKRH
jgi:O-antigen/teichoic acid export membrane protein